MINGVNVIGCFIVLGVLIAWVLMSVMFFIMFEDKDDEME